VHKKNGLINELIPADDLHWDKTSKKHTVLSEQDQDNIFRACLNCGLKDDDAIKVLNCYTFYKTSELLFKHFLEGNIGVYSFTKSGEPIFEPIKEKQILQIYYSPGLLIESPEIWEDKISISKSTKLGISPGIVCSSQSRDLIPFDKMFKTIVSWCLDNGFNIWKGENPDDDNTWLSCKDEDCIKNIKQKGWRLSKADSYEDDSLYLEVELGNWFELIEDTNI